MTTEGQLDLFLDVFVEEETYESPPPAKAKEEVSNVESIEKKEKKKRKPRAKKKEDISEPIVEELPVTETEVEATVQEDIITLPHRSCSVHKGDLVKIGSPIDEEPENKEYIHSNKGKKGIVFDIKEIKRPLDNRYRYNVWVLLNEKNRDIGIFYDLELVKVEDKM